MSAVMVHPTYRDERRHSGEGAKLEFRKVGKIYGTQPALHPTSFDILAGEFFSIIGPSGSGKTTLLGMTAGFVTPTEGSIYVDGTNIVTVPPYERNFGMVFQSYSLFPHMTVAENVAYPLVVRRVPKADIRQRVATMLEMVRLGGFGSRYPSQLSGGQQQRIALARATVYHPQVLLMDEPLGALDKSLREDMQEEIKALHRRLKCTVVYVTHDQAEAAFMSDRVAIMRSGRVEQIGTPRDLYESPSSRFVASFLGEATLLPISDITVGHDGIVEGAIAPGTPVRGSNTRGINGSTLCIRPERISVTPHPTGKATTLTGSVMDVVFATGSIRYRITIPGGHSVIARIPQASGAPAFEPGTIVSVGWDPSDAFIIN